MEDDEEYSYSGYSENTLQHIRENNSEVTTVTGDEEEYSFDGFKDETAVADAAPMGKFYGDFLVEEFSTETTVKRVTKVTRLSEKAVNYIFAVAYLIIGTLCVTIFEQIHYIFPYLVGGFMALIGCVQLIYAIITKEYVHTNSNKTAMSLVLIALSILIIVEKERAYVLIATGWGFLGLLEGAHAFNHAFSRITRNQRSLFYLFKGSVELVLAFMLLYDPEEIVVHIVIFGIQLIFDAITMLPFVKKLFARK